MDALLPVVVLLPLLGAGCVLLVPNQEGVVVRGVGLAAALLTFLVSLGLLGVFDPAAAGFQAEFNRPWVESLGIRFHLGIDGLTLWLVLLTTFLTPVALLAATRAITKKPKEFVASMLILETGMLGAFVALDLFAFYVFWELMLIPMYLIIGIWGGERRVYASIKFVLYTMVGSLLMLVAIFYLYTEHHRLTGSWSFDYTALSTVVLSASAQRWCFAAFALAFAIKVPLWPLHTWLPDAHVEAPTPGSVILAGILLKLGIYGFLRFAFPLFPLATLEMTPWLGLLAVIGIVYGALVAYAQDDAKKLIAYSSVSHLGVAMLGIVAWNARALAGAVFMLVAHGLTTGGLFLGIGALYDRRHTRRIDEFGGLWKAMPVFGALFLIITMGSIGLPGLVGFIGELLVLSGSFGAYELNRATGGALPSLSAHPKVLAAIATTTVVLSAVYMLTLFQRLLFGPNSNPKNQALKDLSPRELVVFAPVIAVILWLGIFPGPVMDRITPTVEHYLTDMQQRIVDLRNVDTESHIRGERSASQGRGPRAALELGGPARALRTGQGRPSAQLVDGSPSRAVVPEAQLVAGVPSARLAVEGVR
jgi:NADH-quinone oxidoreductase subunit M